MDKLQKRKLPLTMDLQLFADGDDGDDDHDLNDDLSGGKTFTQEDVDRIVQERLARAKKPEDYDDLKEISESLTAFGYSGTPAEIKAVIKQQAETRRKAQELEELEEEAEKNGTSPELLAEIKALKDEIKGIKKEKEDRDKAANQAKEAADAWNEQVSVFKTKHPDVDMDKLGENEKFVKFLKKANPSIPFVEVYEDYIDLVGGAEAAAIAKIQSNASRSTSSGKGGGGDASGGTYGLNDHQQKLAKANGMTNKEFAELQSHVKK